MKNQLPNTSKKGFTLVELMVVIAIIAVLAAVGIAVFSTQQQNARDSRRRADIDSYASAYEAGFNSTTGQYPALTGANFAGGVAPVDPTNSGAFVFTTSGALPGTSWTVCAKLEAGSGGNSSNNTGTAAANGGFYCKKNQQS